MPVLSVHLRQEGLARDADSLITRLTARYPSQASSQVNVIGGDFNQLPFVPGTNQQVSVPFRKELITEPHRMTDSIWSHLKEVGIDYIFARGRVTNAGLDTGYDRKQPHDSPGFYSDHQFRWSIVARDAR
jgi:endonuclease/exonuclease/phosphatase family metal-dependent hydrolase